MGSEGSQSGDARRGSQRASEQPIDGIRINARLVIPERELEWRFSASGGPGGQHANTANTRAELVFRVAESAALSEAQRLRILERVGPEIRITSDGERSQLRNRESARQRFAQRVRESLVIPRERRATKPTKGSVERRLTEKAKASERKRGRATSWD